MMNDRKPNRNRKPNRQIYFVDRGTFRRKLDRKQTGSKTGSRSDG
jgi:hypothetical protein